MFGCPPEAHASQQQACAAHQYHIDYQLRIDCKILITEALAPPVTLHLALVQLVLAAQHLLKLIGRGLRGPLLALCSQVGCGVWGVGFFRVLMASGLGVGCGVWGVGCEALEGADDT